MKLRPNLTINTTKELSLRLGIKEELITQTSKKIKQSYSEFKEKDAKGKERHFYQAYGTLKLIHQRIDKRLLNTIEYPKRFQGGIKERSIVSNAQLHTGKKFVVKLDIKSFFPTVTNKQVYQSFRNIGCAPDVARLITQLTTVDGHLPQGFTTSTKVAALVLRNPDKRLLAFLKPLGLTHSFWIDDITISGNQWDDGNLEIVTRIFQQEGLPLNKEKQEIVSKKERQLVTGIVVNKKTNITKEKLRKIKQELHFCEKFGVKEHLQKTEQTLEVRVYLQSLGGRVAQAYSTNPANKILKQQLDRILQTEKKKEAVEIRRNYPMLKK